MTAIFSHQPDTWFFTLSIRILEYLCIRVWKKIFFSPDSNPDWPWVKHLIPQNLRSNNNNNKLIYPPQGVVVRIEWTKKQTVFVNKIKPWLKVILDMLLILNYYMNFNFLSYFPNPQSHHFFVSLSYIHTYTQRVRGIFVFSMISESLEISVLIVCTYSTDFQRLESINMFFFILSLANKN